MAGYPIRVLPDLVLPGIARYARLGSDSHAVTHFDMSGYTYLSGKYAPFAYLGGTRHASLRSHYRVASYLYIVGNLDQVVQLYALMDDGGTHRGTVYARIGTDFHIVFDPMTHPACRMQLFPTRQS